MSYSLFWLAFAWWAIGYVSVLWLSREDCPTWAQLIWWFNLFALSGPVTAVICLVAVLSSLSFWNTKVCDTFKRRKRDADLGDV